VFADSVDLSAPIPSSCPLLPESLRPPSLSFGWIGSPMSAIRNTFGKPSGIRKGWLLYYFAGKETGPYQGSEDAAPVTVEWDISAYVTMKFDKGKVVALRASHLTSY